MSEVASMPCASSGCRRGPKDAQRKLVKHLLPVSLAVAVWCADPARADTAVHEPGARPGILVKTATFEALSSTLETSLFVAFYGGTAAATAGVFAVNLVGSTAIYLAHEYAWESMLAPTADRADPALIAGKSVSYRLLTTVRAFTVGSLLGGAETATSVAFALSVAVADTALYAGTELGFARWRAASSAPP